MPQAPEQLHNSLPAARCLLPEVRAKTLPQQGGEAHGEARCPDKMSLKATAPGGSEDPNPTLEAGQHQATDPLQPAQLSDCSAGKGSLVPKGTHRVELLPATSLEVEVAVWLPRGFRESLAVRWPPCKYGTQTVPSLSRDRKASGALKCRTSGNLVCLYKTPGAPSREVNITRSSSAGCPADKPCAA